MEHGPAQSARKNLNLFTPHNNMASRTYKIYSSAVTSVASGAFAQIAAPARIIAIDFASHITPAAANSGMMYELSLAGTNQIPVNDALNVLAHMINYAQWYSSIGNFQCSANKGLGGLNIPVVTGDRIYVNTTLIGTSPAAANFLAVIFVV